MAIGDSSDCCLQGPTMATTNRPAEANYGLHGLATALPTGPARPAYGKLLLQGLSTALPTTGPARPAYGELLLQGLASATTNKVWRNRLQANH